MSPIEGKINKQLLISKLLFNLIDYTEYYVLRDLLNIKLYY